MTFINNHYLQWIISGTLMGLGFVVPSWWFLGFVGVALFIFLFISQPLSRHFALGVVLALTVKYLYATSIFWSVYPVSFLPIDIGQIQLLIIFAYWLTSSLWLGLGGVLLILGKWFWVNYFTDKTGYFFMPLTALLWVSAEILGSFIFSLMMWGSGGTLNFAYSLGYSGYLLAEHQWLIQLGGLAGVYGLSFLFIWLGFALLVALQKRKRFLAGAAFLLVILSAGTAHTPTGSSSLSGQVAEILVIDTSIKSSFVGEGISFVQRQSLSGAVNEALSQNPDFLLLPESAEFFEQNILNPDTIKDRYPDLTTVIIDSARVHGTNGRKLEALIYDAATTDYRRVAKSYLVPQGEYLPYVYSGLFKLFDQHQLVEYVEENINFVVGDNTSQNLLPTNVPAILFCFESVDPVGVRRLIKDHPTAPFIAHPVSHAWFNQSEILWDQLDNMLQLQAVWNQRHIVSASNYGRSQVYTPEGKITDMEELGSGLNWSLKKAVIELN